MITKIIEATNHEFNWGKFLVAKFDTEWERKVKITDPPGGGLLRTRGWDNQHVWVLDLETGEGAYFRHRGHASADLNKHHIWVCPLFEPFLEWLYGQDITDITKLPDTVNLPDAPPDMYGYRREGLPRSPEAQRAYEDGVRDGQTLKREQGGG